MIITEDQNGIRKSTGFSLFIGKFSKFYPEDDEIKIFVNGMITPVKMKLSTNGIGYFEISKEI